MNTNVAAWSRLMKRVNTSASTPPPQSRKPATDAFQLAEQNDSKHQTSSPTPGGFSPALLQELSQKIPSQRAKQYMGDYTSSNGMSGDVNHARNPPTQKDPSSKPQSRDSYRLAQE